MLFGAAPARDGPAARKRSQRSRARCSALLIEAVVAEQCRRFGRRQTENPQSRRIARWRGGNSWIAATKASCTASRRIARFRIGRVVGSLRWNRIRLEPGDIGGGGHPAFAWPMANLIGQQPLHVLATFNAFRQALVVIL